MSYDPTLIGVYREPETYICIINNVKVGGTPALDASGWERLPVEESSSVKAEVEKFAKKNVAGKNVFRKAIKSGYVYSSHFLQRDQDALELEDTYINKDCILLIKGHNFADLSTPVQQHRLIFGTVTPSDAEITHEEGAPDFMFESKDNAVAIDIGTGGTLNLAIPTDYDLTGNIEIAAHGMQKVLDE